MSMNCERKVSSVSSGVPALTESTNWINLSTLRLFNGVPMNRNGGSASSHYLTTGWFGQPDKLLTLQRVNPIFSIRPGAVNAGVTVYPSVTPGESSSSGGATMNASYRFDTLGPVTGGNATSNYFSFKLAFAASSTRTEIVDVVPKLVPAGER
jgi:hypothetical protein